MTARDSILRPLRPEERSFVYRAIRIDEQHKALVRSTASPDHGKRPGPDGRL